MSPKVPRDKCSAHRKMIFNLRYKFYSSISKVAVILHFSRYFLRDFYSLLLLKNTVCKWGPSFIREVVGMVKIEKVHILLVLIIIPSGMLVSNL